MMASKKVILVVQASHVILDNGILKLTLSKPSGLLTAIQYGGLDNLLDTKLSESQRGYWDLNWNLPGGQDRYQMLSGVDFSVIGSSNDCVEVSFRRVWDSSATGTRLPLSFDIRYIVRSGVSGFYSYAIYERSAGLPSFDLTQARMVFKLRRDQFHYMAISDKKQRIMPTIEDIRPPRGEVLALPESVLLKDPINPALKGQVDDKYQYSMDNKDGGVHGWISSGPTQPLGFWLIFPSHEFRSGGPTKQNLTAHTGPACLAMFHGCHYIGEGIVAAFTEGEAWRKVFGPIFIYLNLTQSISNAYGLWMDAKKQWLHEETTWPYNFISPPYFLTAQERGSASGNFFVQDRFQPKSDKTIFAYKTAINGVSVHKAPTIAGFGECTLFVSESLLPAKFAYIGLSVATRAGSWQIESKGYQFWVVTDSEGAFTIKNVVPGAYYVHGWVPGFIGDYLHSKLVNILPGSEIQLGNLIYIPPRDGPTIWEIGFPDRTAMGFYVPNPNPIYINKLFIDSPEKYRQYGLWDRYTNLHPQHDQTFMIGFSDVKKDWFFAHVNRKITDISYSPTTWKIRFNLNTVTSGTYKLRLSIAASNHSDLQVWINDLYASQPLFEAYDLGADSTIARHGIHGLYQIFSIEVHSTLFVKGDNTVYLKQAMSGNEFLGLLYDYIRLEAPATLVEG